MKGKLCVSERRTRIIEFLEVVKVTTRDELSRKFDVSPETIRRDVLYLSSVAPIYTKRGHKGGIFIVPTYHGRHYLSDTEEKCLLSLIKKSDDTQREIICGIITRFTKNQYLHI